MKRLACAEPLLEVSLICEAVLLPDSTSPDKVDRKLYLLNCCRYRSLPLDTCDCQWGVIPVVPGLAGRDMRPNSRPIWTSMAEKTIAPPRRVREDGTS